MLCFIRLSLSSLFVHSLANPFIFPDSIFDLLNSSWVIFGNIDAADISELESSIQSADSEPSSLKLVKECPSSAICLGCGVVRTIDLQENCLHVLMPHALATQPEQSGAKVANLLVLPDLVSIPSGLLNEQFLYQGASSLPYIFSYFEPK